MEGWEMGVRGSAGGGVAACMLLGSGGGWRGWKQTHTLFGNGGGLEDIGGLGVETEPSRSIGERRGS